MSRIAYVNGRYLPFRDAKVHVEDRGYQFGDGVYEVCEVRDGLLIDQRRHSAGREGLRTRRDGEQRNREGPDDEDCGTGVLVVEVVAPGEQERKHREAIDEERGGLRAVPEGAKHPAWEA